jgi:rfaE bifunctional protein nucleotidyltransferase chain/domain
MNNWKNQIEKWKKEGKKIVFTNGCFDIIHAGHVDYLQKAKSLGDVLVVGLNSDSSVKRLKGEERPINPLEYRKKVLEALKPVDLVIVFEEDTPESLIKAVKPDILVKGGDYTIENIVGADFVQSYGGKVITIDFVYDVSTTKIAKKIRGEK